MNIFFLHVLALVASNGFTSFMLWKFVLARFMKFADYFCQDGTFLLIFSKSERGYVLLTAMEENEQQIMVIDSDIFWRKDDVDSFGTTRNYFLKMGALHASLKIYKVQFFYYISRIIRKLYVVLYRVIKFFLLLQIEVKHVTRRQINVTKILKKIKFSENLNIAKSQRNNKNNTNFEFIKSSI